MSYSSAPFAVPCAALLLAFSVSGCATDDRLRAETSALDLPPDWDDPFPSGDNNCEPPAPDIEIVGEASHTEAFELCLQSSVFGSCKTRLGWDESDRDVLEVPSFESAVPVKSVFALRSVNCGPRSGPALRLRRADGDNEILATFPETWDAVVEVRTDVPMTEIILEHAYSKQSRFLRWIPEYCRAEVEAHFNLPDVDDAAEAYAIVTAIEADIGEEQVDLGRLRRELLALSGYVLIDAVAQSLHRELTSELMQELRIAAQDAAPALESAMFECTNLPPDHQTALFSLYSSLAAVGSPEDWLNPDGSTKTVADLIGPDAAQAVAELNTLIGAGHIAQVEQEITDTAAAIATLEAKLALAHQQLRPWLTSGQE